MSERQGYKLADSAQASEQTGMANGAAASQSGPSRSLTCRSARKGLRYYQRAEHRWRNRMAQETQGAEKPRTCARAQYLAERWRVKARAARLAFARWHSNEWNWRAWLPSKWYRIARCETGVRWDWNSGAYQGAFGFAVSSWDAFRLPGYPSEAYLATPHQQYEVALAIWRRYGLSGWGCRDA